MIAIVNGDIGEVTDESIVVMVSGVGLAVATPLALRTGARVGEAISLYTSLVVREDSLTLFGFASPADRTIFELLQSVSGVGPRTALAALDTFSANELSGIVAQGDEKSLMKISGIGRKGAQRLILELSDKLPSLPVAAVANGNAAVASEWPEQVAAGLVSLGWSVREAQMAVETVQAEGHIDLSDERGEQDLVAEMLAKALRVMGGRNG